MKRRKRSHLTEEESIKEIKKYAEKIERMLETNQGIDGWAGSFAPEDEISTMISVKGSFGASNNFFSALRVLGGHMLPRKTESRTENHSNCKI
jgi:hypothetical protein